MQSLMLLKLIAHKGAGDVSHQEMVWDSGRLHFKTKVDQLWGLCHCHSKFKLNWCKKYENLGSFRNEWDYQREKLMFVGDVEDGSVLGKSVKCFPSIKTAFSLHCSSATAPQPDRCQFYREIVKYSQYVTAQNKSGPIKKQAKPISKSPPKDYQEAPSIDNSAVLNCCQGLAACCSLFIN